MASEPAFRQFRHDEEQAFLECRRTDIRNQQTLKYLSELKVPASQKRRLIHEIVFYSKCTNYEKGDPLPDTSYGFAKLAIAGSSATASTSCAEDSATGPTSTASNSAEESAGDFTTSRTASRTETSSLGTISEEVEDDFTTSPTAGLVRSRTTEPVEEELHEEFRNSRTSEAVETSTKPDDELVDDELVTASPSSDLVDQSLNESDNFAVNEKSASEQNSPERTRRSEDFILKIHKLSPTLSAHRICTTETAEETEAEEAIEDFTKGSKVPFFKAGRLFPKAKYKVAYSLIYRCFVEEEASEALHRSETNSDASKMLLVPDNVQAEVQRLAREFSRIFNYRIMECDAVKGSFDERVTHVLTNLDTPDCLKFAQYQAIGCRRYLISSDWLQESLEKRRILPEDPYELIFTDEVTGQTIARPSQYARLMDKKIFRGFAVLMAGPFDDFEELQMMRLLIMNGAEVYNNPRQLINLRNQARICIIEPRYYRNKNRDLLKQKSAYYKFVAVHYQWLYDTFLMYQAQSLLRYLHFAKPEEALKAGVPTELLK